MFSLEMKERGNDPLAAGDTTESITEKEVSDGEDPLMSPSLERGMDLNDVEMAMVEIKPATKGKLYKGKSASSK